MNDILISWANVSCLDSPLSRRLCFSRSWNPAIDLQLFQIPLSLAQIGRAAPYPHTLGILSFRNLMLHKPPLSAAEKPGLCRHKSCCASCLLSLSLGISNFCLV